MKHEPDLFQKAPMPVFAWQYEDGEWRGVAHGGATARIWLSAVSEKLVLTVSVPGHLASIHRVHSVDAGKVQADVALREDFNGK